MIRNTPRFVFGTCALVGAMMVCGTTRLSGQESRFKNLQVLPQDISNDELSDIMLENLRGLGLRRLLGQGCLYCHVGSLDIPRREWDYASDEKPTKQKARVMMKMVAAINQEHLSTLEDRRFPGLRVTCNTCHAGRTDPRPLSDVLWGAYQTGGTDSVATTYRTLREQFEHADAYDFRPASLTALARQLATDPTYDDAIVIAQLNIEAFPNDLSPQRTLMQLQVEQTLARSGVDSALAVFDALTLASREGVATVATLDAIGWMLNRTERPREAMTLFRANRERFPEQYTPLESLAFALSSENELAEAIALLEGWIQRHPDHERAIQTLTNMRRPNN